MSKVPSPEKPWGPMDPNSEHQLWSYWRFEVVDLRAHLRRRSLANVRENVHRYFQMIFGSVGQARVTQKVSKWIIELRVEGVPAQDPEFVESVKKDFEEKFVFQGFGPMATVSLTTRILAGDAQDGKPRKQLIVAPGEES